MPHPNKFKYLKAPTIEQIEAVVKKAGVTDAQFERYNHIHEGAIKKIRQGKKQMPTKHWHLFFETYPSHGVFSVAKPTSQTPKPRTKLKTNGQLSRLI